MTLTFIKKYELFSAYRCDDGTTVYLGHGDMKPWTSDWDQALYNRLFQEMALDLSEFQKFAEVAASLCSDLTQCGDCAEITIETYDTVEGNQVCEVCRNDCYCWCAQCEDLVHADYTYSAQDDTLCESCAMEYTTWCSECDERFYDSDDHEHEHDCDCEAPAQEFAVRNGDETLKDNQRVTVSLPAGVISDEGIEEIVRHLNDALSNFLAAAEARNLDPRWQTKDGNFTKRLSRAIHKGYKIKLTPTLMSHIGNIARDNSTPVSHHVEVTRDLNLSSEAFGNDGSCWWGSYSSSRCALKSNGGFGLRSFSELEGDCVTGRAWVLPLRRDDLMSHGVAVIKADGTTEFLLPTFETLEPAAFVVFNGYGDLGGYVAARIVAQMAGMTYRKINLGLDPMYVNSNVGYLVASEELAEPFTDGSLMLPVDDHSNLYQEEILAMLPENATANQTTRETVNA